MTAPIRMLVAVVAVIPATAAEPTECPATIVVDQRLAKPVPGWTAMLDDTPHQLAGITFYDGPPEEKASLVYDAINQSAGKQIATWRFDQRAGRPIWVTCSYSGTSVVMKRPLAPRIAQCSVTYNSKESVAGLPAIERITCR